ncbi:hypothetical protein QQF64_016901 [Cirrhinus molitorella]|uniref:Uncharacterized protein n=1 Tax=Cirrhinus molitorella TaxID=172907 RepID=A0ABR3LP33_9TELE
MSAETSQRDVGKCGCLMLQTTVDFGTIYRNILPGRTFGISMMKTAAQSIPTPKRPTGLPSWTGSKCFDRGRLEKLGVVWCGSASSGPDDPLHIQWNVYPVVLWFERQENVTAKTSCLFTGGKLCRGL